MMIQAWVLTNIGN